MTTTANIAPTATEQTRNDVTQASASLIGRVLLSAIFILSGFSKLAAPAMMVGYISSVGLPLPQLALALDPIVMARCS